MYKKILVLLFLGFYGCADSSELELEGKLSMTGSSIHTYMVIKDTKTHKIYKIKNAKAFGLMKRQKEIVKMKAKLLVASTAPGLPSIVDVIQLY